MTSVTCAGANGSIITLKFSSSANLFVGQELAAAIKVCPGTFLGAA